MNAAIIERNWVVEWFDERQCYHMPVSYTHLTLPTNSRG